VVTVPPTEFDLAPQPIYGPLRPILPAHRLALLESGQRLLENDPLVASFAQALGQLTARYVEDASRIAEITSSLCREIRRRQKPASPAEILDAALRWNRPTGTRTDVPRRFSEFARLYQTLRIKQGKDHKAALATLVPPPAVKPSTP
jgi:hypothetical protein